MFSFLGLLVLCCGDPFSPFLLLGTSDVTSDALQKENSFEDSAASDCGAAPRNTVYLSLTLNPKPSVSTVP